MAFARGRLRTALSIGFNKAWASLKPTRLRKRMLTGWGVALRDDMRAVLQRLNRLEGAGGVGVLTARVDELQQSVGELQRRVRQQAESIRWLAERAAEPLSTSPGSAEPPATLPLVSIIMPVKNRARTIAAAIESVLAQTWNAWELIIVDDQSRDDTMDVVRSFAQDSRVLCLANEGTGVSAARNTGLRRARGRFVAYLDSDNTWFPGFLAAAVDRLSDGAASGYAAQLVENASQKNAYIRALRFQREEYLREGGIDLNAFVHRKELFDRHGGFDESMTRLVDWELIARYTRDSDPVVIPTIAGRYCEHGADSISAKESYFLNRYRLHRKHLPPASRRPKVLYVVWDYPQLTESYVRWEIACLQRWGADIEVWTELRQTNAPYESEVPVHCGDLEAAIRAVQPDVVHLHWMHFARKHRDAVARFGIPMTVRGHGFEFSPELLGSLIDDPAIRRIYAFPHFAASHPRSPKVVATPAAFNGDLYFPGEEKDPFLVVRAASAKPSKRVEEFIDAARLCPEHRFVLALGRINSQAEYLQQLLDYNRSCGAPVEIHVNMPTEEVARLVRKAGVYLHTYGTEEPFGMPISIAEAMATGCLTLLPDRPGAAGYAGPVGQVYRDVAEAAQIIGHSANWPRGLWDDVRRRTVDWAYQNFADDRILRPILDDWRQVSDFQVGVNLTDHTEDARLQGLIDLLEQESGMSHREFRDNSRLAHNLGVYRYLRKWGCSWDVAISGLFHNIYTPPRQLFSLSRREFLRERIGPHAELLAYARCAFTHGDATFARPEIQRLLDVSSERRRIPDRFTGGELELDARQFHDLCCLVLADWVEKSPRDIERENPEVYRRVASEILPAAWSDFETVCRLSGHPAEGIRPDEQRRDAA